MSTRVSTLAGPILTVERVGKSFGGLRALDSVSFEVERHSITGLIGPNGSGKSTMFNCVTGFLRVNNGAIRLNGVPIETQESYAIARGGIARTFQTTRMPSRMTVLETLLVAAPGNENEHWFDAIFRRGAIRKQERHNVARAREILKMVGIAHVENEYAAQLSGGQQRLLSIGCALFRDPEIIMLDEPAAGVNPSLVRDLMGLIKRLRDELGKTFVIVEHDMNFISRICDKVIVLDAGIKIADGTPDLIRTDERVLEVYLGGKRT